MKRFTVQRWVYFFIALFLSACTGKDAKKQFGISGVITNNTAQKIYLEELPAGPGPLQGMVVDSSVIGKDGRYQLKTESKEATLYNLRIGQSEFPAASVINDVASVTLDIDLNKQDNRFADKYEVKESPATTEMKNFVNSFETDLRQLYNIGRMADSLQKAKAPDSLMAPLEANWRMTAANIKNQASAGISKADNPALVLFELGYVQEISRRYDLALLDIDEVNAIINKSAVKFPDHKGLAGVKRDLAGIIASRQQRPVQTGKPAPGFSLPDVNGNLVSLASFKGKYVLIDFWASWCRPCREENPNVVKAFNKFKDKNFTVFGVSLDRPGEKNEWLKAIRQDNLTWTHVSELKYWDSQVVPLYGLDGIPYNVLVDTTGIVIGENLRGAALEAKLEEVLK